MSIKVLDHYITLPLTSRNFLSLNHWTCFQWNYTAYKIDESNIHVTKWATAWQNQQYNLCTQRRLRSACALAVHSMGKDPSFFHADAEDWSDWADAHADLSLHWVHRSFCWLCHASGLIYYSHYYSLLKCNPLNMKEFFRKRSFNLTEIKRVFGDNYLLFDNPSV